MGNQANRHIAPSKLPGRSERLSVIIPAAAIGKRMKSKGPKGLLPVNHGMSILELQIRQILKIYPYADIVIVGGFQCDKIRNALWGDFPIRIVCNHLYESTSITQSIAMGLDATLPGPLLIMYGDLVFNNRAIKNLAGNKSAMLVANKQLDDDKMGICHQDGLVTTLSYALPIKWGQMVYLQRQELKLFIDIMWNNRLASQLLLHEVLNNVMENGGVFLAHEPRGMKIIEINRYTDLMKAKSI